MYCKCAALWGMMEWIGAKQERRGSSCLFVLYLVYQKMVGVGEHRTVL